jgi:tetratricopeptide (TPR) repeat protein
MQGWLGDDASITIVHEGAACLRAAAVDFVAASEVIAAAESDPVIVASPLVASLPRPIRCLAAYSDRVALRTSEARVDRRPEIARVRALRLAQRHEQALSAADALLKEGVLDDEPAQLAALELERGRALLRVDRLPEGARVLQRAFSLAEVAGERRLALIAASAIAEASERLEVDPYTFEAWAERTILLAERLRDPTMVLEGRLLLGRAALQLGDPDRALALQLDALARAERELGPQAIELAYAHDYIGGLQAELGHVEPALAHKREAVAILERELGPEHLDLATLLETSANVHAMLGRREQARALYQRALEILAARLGLDHWRARTLARRFANFLYDDGDPAQAEATLGDDRGNAATLARARWAIVAGEFQDARDLLGALGDPLTEALEATMTDDTPLRAELLAAHAELALAEGRLDDARTIADVLRTLTRSGVGSELGALLIEAELELATGSPTAATDLALRRALARTDAPPARRAHALVLRWRYAAPSEREQARAAGLLAVTKAFGPEHPYRRALESAEP